MQANDKRSLGPTILGAIVFVWSLLLLLALVFVVPRFEKQFIDFDFDLPAITVQLILAVRFLKSQFFLLPVLATAPAALVGTACYFDRNAASVLALVLIVGLCLLTVFAVVALVLPSIQLWQALA